MKKQIELTDLARYSQKYNQIKNTELEEQLRTQKFRQFCLNQDVYNENKFEFNVDLGNVKIANQYTTKLCWLYATLNFLKTNVAQNLNIDKSNFLLSYNYLAFYDKLEKANSLYQTIIDLEDTANFSFCDGLTDKNLKSFLKEPFRENGSIYFAIHLIEKYGILPFELMPETSVFKDPDDFVKIYTQKLRYDIFKLVEAKNNEKDVYELKDKFIEENYIILSKVLGEPITHFSYEYTDKNGKSNIIKDITPLEFYDKYCSINFDDYTLVGSDEVPSKEYYKMYQRNYYQSIFDEKSPFLNIPFSEFKDLVTKQILSNEAVMFGTENKKYRDLNSNVLDMRLFDYEKHLEIKDLTRKQAQESLDITMKHWMVFRGVHINSDKPVRWKVEDSRGVSEKSNGYYVMNDNFFDHCVMFAFINKKHLTKKQLDALNQEIILYTKVSM